MSAALFVEEEWKDMTELLHQKGDGEESKDCISRTRVFLCELICVLWLLSTRSTVCPSVSILAASL